MKHWMTNCRCVSEKASELIDRPLPLHHRLFLQIHMLLCGYCSKSRRQMMLLRRCSQAEDATAEEMPALSGKTRQRISEALRKKS